MLNGIALIFLAIYGGSVLINRRTTDLYDLLKGEGGFLIWIAALGVVYAIYQSPSVHPIGKGIAGLTIAGLAVKVTTNAGVIKLASELASGATTIKGAMQQLVPPVSTPKVSP